MNLKRRVQKGVQQGMLGDMSSLDRIVESEAGSVRFLLGETYRSDPSVRSVAATALGRAARFHPELIEEVARRLIWAMNDESGTNALAAPQVLETIAREAPEVLVPLVPDLIRLSAEPELREGLLSTLEVLKKACPGEVGKSLSSSLKKRLERTRREWRR